MKITSVSSNIPSNRRFYTGMANKNAQENGKYSNKFCANFKDID